MISLVNIRSFEHAGITVLRPVTAFANFKEWMEARQKDCIKFYVVFRFMTSGM